MFRKLLIVISLAVVSIASAETFKLTLYQDSYIGEKLLKQGGYKLQVDGGKVTFIRGKQSVEAEAKVENAETKHAATSIRFENGGGKYHIQAIFLGGTTTTLVFEP